MTTSYNSDTLLNLHNCSGRDLARNDETQDSYQQLGQAARTKKYVRNKDSKVSEQSSGAMSALGKTIMADKKLKNMTIMVNNYSYKK